MIVAMIAMIWIGVTVGNAAAATHHKFTAARRTP